MTGRRAPDFDLDHALADPGFTPRAADIPLLLDRVAAGGDDAVVAERALGRVGLAAGHAAASRASSAEPAPRAKLTRLVGRIAAQHGDADLTAYLVAGVADPDERVRRAAATALGKVRPAGAEEALTAALATETSAPARRALVEALGKVGGEGALAALERAGSDEGADDVETRARLIVTRGLARLTPSTIDTARPSPGPTLVALRCRAGLESILSDELGADLAPRTVRRMPGGPRVEVTLAGPIEQLFRARTMLSFSFPLPEIPVATADDLAGAIAAALTSNEALAIFRHFTTGPLRYRVAWASGGKRRATVWHAAEEVARRSTPPGGVAELINDPTESPWEAVVHEAPGVIRVELTPKIVDPRFAYRLGDVPAASHPTIAAALVRVAGARADDVVWDPFVGSGMELCERALAGPYRMLIGSDREARALEVARTNLTAAGAATATLILGDATVLVPPVAPTLIITNPPLGRRVLRSADLSAMLERFIEHAARTLAPGGRLVWISPFPDRTEAAARRSGLVLGASNDLDMGGFVARLQAFRRGGSGVTAARGANRGRP